MYILVELEKREKRGLIENYAYINLGIPIFLQLMYETIYPYSLPFL